MASVIKTLWTCPDNRCDGSGEVYDPGLNRCFRCTCHSRMIPSLAREKAGIPRNYYDADFTEFDAIPTQAPVLAAVKDWADNWEENRRSGHGLAILGSTTGLGKSYLAIAACLSIMQRHWTKSVLDQDVCLFVNVMNWFDSWHRFYAMFPPAEKGSALREEQMESMEFSSTSKKLSIRDERMFTTELLVLDDLSKFEPKTNRLDRLYSVIDHRTANALPMIVTDNLSTWPRIAAKLGDMYGPPITDRFARSTDTLVIESALKKKGKKKKVAA